MSAELMKHTEAAMALLEGKLADVVYLPPSVRRNRLRLNSRGQATTAPLSAKESLDRITLADPLGFLLAIMNGQPVVTFAAETKEVEPKETHKRTQKKFPQLRLGKVDGAEIIAHLHVPSVDERVDIAKFLMPYVTERRKKQKNNEEEQAPDDFEMILNQRIQQVNDGSAQS